jgi:conjugal transfer pilin signal peptidase TrbI
MLMNFKSQIMQFFKDKTHVIIFSGILFIILIFLVKPAAPRIVSFNFKDTYATFFREAVRNNISRDKMLILGNRFPIALEKAVKTYADKNHVIIFVNGAVVAGAEDVTPAIQRLISIEMQKLAKQGTPL